MDSIKKEQLLEEYCSNEMKGLKRICDPIIFKKGVPQMEYDDLYSAALDTLYNSIERYDETTDCTFNTFLTGNIKRTFFDWTRDKRRFKRCNTAKDENGEIIVISDISIDAPTEDGIDLCERVASNFRIEDELPEEIGFSSDERVEKYIKSLSQTQRKIAELVMVGYLPVEIRKILDITEKQYTDFIRDMKSFEKSRLLKHNDYVQIEEDIPMQEIQTQTLEKSKPDKLSIASIIKKIENYTIRFDHPLQRESEQWSPTMKGNLISDILQGNPIPPLVFAEQIINGLAIIWDLDGKQRCTNVYSFRGDGYKLTKNIRRWNISFQATIKDENGKPVLDEKGFPQSEKREFDIRGKKYSDLPEELKDRFNDYNFEIVQYLNCSSEDIAYHIARYNEGKPMTASQKGITRLGEEFASMVKSISAMPFFKDLGGYKVSEGSNGTTNRVVIESVMAANFLDDWKKKQEDMCEYMKENATSEHFDNFEDMVERITSVASKDVFEMFDSKDSFIWFGLFARFVNTGLDDGKFIEFMAEFSQSLHNEIINGVSFDELNGKSTKDKNVVISKIEHLEKLMIDYLNINIDETQTEVASILDFVQENVNSDIQEEDVEQYEEVLDALTLDVDNSSKLLDEKNKPSLVALVAYSFANDFDLDEWIVNFFANNNSFNKNQKENYIYMRHDLDKLIEVSQRQLAS